MRRPGCQAGEAMMPYLVSVSAQTSAQVHERLEVNELSAASTRNLSLTKLHFATDLVFGSSRDR